jgi:hypothetical protein
MMNDEEKTGSAEERKSGRAEKKRREEKAGEKLSEPRITLMTLMTLILKIF